MRGIPQDQAGLNLTYRRELAGEGSVYASGNLTYQSDVDLDDFDGEFAHEDAYTLAKFRFGVDGINGTGLGAAFFINNAFDELYRVGVLGLIREIGFLSSVYGEPRNYGVEVSYKF